MKKDFKTYTLEDFLDDSDFCSWVRSERPDLDGYYHRLIAENQEQRELFQKAYKLIRLFDDEKEITDLSRKLQLWEEIKQVYHQQESPKKFRLVFRYAAAIALLFTVASTSYYYFYESTSKNQFIASYNDQDFTETRLSLDNGKEIKIQSDRSEIVYDQNGEQLKVDDKQIDKEITTRAGAMNELVVSFGKQSRIVLSDRTEVWLNAGSRLIYPSVFDKRKRKVQLQGEAFFKVSKDKTHPFIVETDNSAIEVLGTSFNVRAYPDEKYEEAVLVEGSVSFKLGQSAWSKKVLLKPDQRLVVSNTDESYKVSKVEVTDYTLWIQGLFVFNDEPLSSVIMQIARYYNIKIKWLDNDENRRISGKLDLKDDCQRVLQALALISDGNYIEKEGVIYFKINDKNEVKRN